MQSERTKQEDSQINRDGVNVIYVDKAYNKTVTVKLQGVKEETEEERIERRMREWEEARQEKTQQRTKSQEM